jgi:hypothetical protein
MDRFFQTKVVKNEKFFVVFCTLFHHDDVGELHSDDKSIVIMSSISAVC